MKIGMSFSYMFKDGTWFTKVFVGGLFLVLSLFVVGVPFILGYEVELVRRKSGALELPEWNDLRRLFRDGLMVFGATILYGALTYILLTFLSGVPRSWLSAAAVATGLFFWLPLVVIRFAEDSSILACLSLARLLSPVLRHPLEAGTALATSSGTIILALCLGWMSLIVGWPFVVFWGISVQAHLLGQLART